ARRRSAHVHVTFPARAVALQRSNLVTSQPEGPGRVQYEATEHERKMVEMTRRRFTTGGAIVGGAPALLAACAAGTARAAAAEGVPTPGVRSGVTVTVAQGGNQTNADARNEIHKAFAAAHPQIKPELVFVTTNLQEKIQALISAGTPPDLFNAGN